MKRVLPYLRMTKQSCSKLLSFRWNVRGKCHTPSLFQFYEQISRAKMPSLPEEDLKAGVLLYTKGAFFPSKVQLLGRQMARIP